MRYGTEIQITLLDDNQQKAYDAEVFEVDGDYHIIIEGEELEDLQPRHAVRDAVFAAVDELVRRRDEEAR